jgi:hypothetical protein
LIDSILLSLKALAMELRHLRYFVALASGVPHAAWRFLNHP